MLRVSLLLIIVSCLLSGCGQHKPKYPYKTVLDNGEYVIINKQQVSLFTKAGQLVQQSTFASPTLVEAKGFLAEVQADLRLKDYGTLIENSIHYPLRVNKSGKTIFYKNSIELQAHFEQVFTDVILNDISQQNPYRLFANSQGVMIANGSVWFDRKGITVINISSDQNQKKLGNGDRDHKSAA